MTDSDNGWSAVAVNENGESIPWGLWNVRDMIHENRATGGWDYRRHLDNDQRMHWPAATNTESHGLHPKARQTAPSRGPIIPTRLLNCKTGLVEASLERDLPYTTISHVWSETAGKDWGQFAVQLWMKYGVQYIWVDSLCINQASVQDKANEIPKMAEYYAGAEMNIIPMTAPGLRRSLDDWLEGGARASQQNFSEVLKFIQALVENPYFERVWTMQETALARCTHLETPDGIIYSWEIDEAVRRACGIPSYPRSPEDPPTCRDTKASSDPGIGQIDNRVVLFDNRHIRGALSTQAWIARNRRPLALVWRMAQNRRCTVAKDALWGMVAMIEGGDFIETTYKEPVAQVLEELVEKGLLGLEILCVRKTIASPSWVPVLENEVPLMGAECTIEPARRKVTIRDGGIEVSAKEVVASDVKGDYYVRIADTDHSQEIVMMTEGWDFESNNLPGRRHWLILMEGTESRVTFLLISDRNEAGNIVHKVDALQCGLELPTEAFSWILDGQVDIRIE